MFNSLSDIYVPMNRRTYMRYGASAGGILAFAGCLGRARRGRVGGSGDASNGTIVRDASPTDTTSGAVTTPSDRPDGVYVQGFDETMYVAETTPTVGDYRFGLMYAVPHVFWNLTGSTVQETPITDGDSLHLMATVWDPETGTVLPETDLSVELLEDGEFISQEVIYPMLSQQMGFHYGANFALPGDGIYTARLRVAGSSVRRTGAFAGRFERPGTVDIEFPFTPQARREVTSVSLGNAYEPGELAVLDMRMMPTAIAPSPDALPGTGLGTATSDDAEFVVLLIEGGDAARFLDTGGVTVEAADDRRTSGATTGTAESSSEAGAYLAVSARTPYNRILLPAMALSGRVIRGGETILDGELVRTLDPVLDYHYGAPVESVESGDVLTITVDTPPQTARHEGYETAFVQMPPMEMVV